MKSSILLFSEYASLYKALSLPGEMMMLNCRPVCPFLLSIWLILSGACDSMTIQAQPIPNQRLYSEKTAFIVSSVQETGNLKMLQAEATINAPLTTVWNTLVDYDNLKNILPGYERSTLLKSAGNIKIVDIKLQNSGLLPAFQYQVKIQEEKSANRLNIQRISGDFNHITASYSLTSVAGGTKTHLFYRLAIDPGSSFLVPGINHLLRTSTTKALQALTSYCNHSYQRSLTAEAH
jgi:carbon monoxide dehydrogenase subunit G